MKIGQFGDFHAGLEKKLDNSRNPDIEANCVTQILNFDGSQNPGWENVIFGVSKQVGGIYRD